MLGWGDSMVTGPLVHLQPRALGPCGCRAMSELGVFPMPVETKARVPVAWGCFLGFGPMSHSRNCGRDRRALLPQFTVSLLCQALRTLHSEVELSLGTCWQWCCGHTARTKSPSLTHVSL